MQRLKSQLFKEYEKKIAIINNKSSKKEQEVDLTNYMQSIENELAKIANREPAIVKIEIVADGFNVENPYYDNTTNVIKMQYNAMVEPLEFLSSLIHESEHTNQNLAKNSSSEKSYLYQISQVLYVTPSCEGNAVEREYTCNYRELEAKKSEMQFLINLYKEAIRENKEKYNGDNTLSISDGLKYMRLFKNISNNISLITQTEVLKLMTSNVARLMSSDYNKEEYLEFNKFDALKFLISKGTKYYIDMWNEIKALKDEILQISNELTDKYKTNISKTTIYLNDRKVKEIKNREEKIKNIEKLDKYCSYLDMTKTYNSKIFEDIELLKKEAEKLQNDPFVVKINVFGDIRENVYELRYITIDKDIAGNEVLEEKNTSTSQKTIDYGKSPMIMNEADILNK